MVMAMLAGVVMAMLAGVVLAGLLTIKVFRNYNKDSKQRIQNKSRKVIYWCGQLIVCVVVSK